MSAAENEITPPGISRAELVRAQIADGALMPGGAAPSGAALARLTGYSDLTCRRALRVLIAEGTLLPGVTPNSRPRVPAPEGQARAGAARCGSGSGGYPGIARALVPYARLA